MDTVAATTKLASNIFSCFSRALEFTIVVFLTSQYVKSKSNYKSAYFIILNIGYIADLILFLNWALPLPLTTYYYTLVIFEWYSVYFTTMWNVVLCLNRCTALAYSVKYEIIWNPLTMFFVIIAMLAFPFAVDAYTLFEADCSVQTFGKCLTFRKGYFFKGTLVNGGLNAIMILLIAFSMYRSRKDELKTHSIHAKTERRLIYQAIFSSVFQLLCFALKFMSGNSTDNNFFLAYMYISNLFYHFHHFGLMITHFILSPTFKNSYLYFYHLGFLVSKTTQVTAISKISKVTKISAPRTVA